MVKHCKDRFSRNEAQIILGGSQKKNLFKILIASFKIAVVWIQKEKFHMSAS